MKKGLLFTLGICLSAATVYAQQPLREMPGGPGMAPQELRFSPGSQPRFVRGEVLLHTGATLKASAEVILSHAETDGIGQEHIRYQQTINGIPVDGTVYIVHVTEGKVISENGAWVADIPANLPAVPSISGDAALQLAMKAFGANVYKWQLPAEEQFIKQESDNPAATFFPKADLVYYSGEGVVSPDHMRLAYRFDMYAHEPLGRRLYFVDAANGEVLGIREILHTVDATGSAVTAYSGTQAITTDSYSGSYRLREAARGNGILTYNLKKGTSYAGAVDFTDADNAWSNVNTALDQYATDAHWGAEKTYDYYKNTFGRNSIDNAGYALK